MAASVSKKECNKMIRLHEEEGWEIVEIAKGLDRSYGAVKHHCDRGCRHFREDIPTGADTIEDVGAEIDRLADEKGLVPSPEDWNKWPKRACCAKSLMRRHGSWKKVLEQSSHPAISTDVARFVREQVYQNPKMAETILDTDVEVSV